MNNEIGLNVFGLLSGRIVVAHDEDLRVLVTWNESLTFQVWSEDGGWFREQDFGWTAQDVPTLEEAKRSAREHLRLMAEDAQDERIYDLDEADAD